MKSTVVAALMKQSRKKSAEGEVRRQTRSGEKKKVSDSLAVAEWAGAERNSSVRSRDEGEGGKTFWKARDGELLVG